MNKRKKKLPENGMKDLEDFYTRKKVEQEALKKLLKALDEKSKKEKNGEYQ